MRYSIFQKRAVNGVLNVCFTEPTDDFATLVAELRTCEALGQREAEALALALNDNLTVYIAVWDAMAYLVGNVHALNTLITGSEANCASV